VTEQLDIEGYVRGAQDARRAAAEQAAEERDEQAAADRLAGMLTELHAALDAALCPECREAVRAKLAEEPL